MAKSLGLAIRYTSIYEWQEAFILVSYGPRETLETFSIPSPHLNESQKHTPIDRLKLDPQYPLSRAPLYETVLLASLGIQHGLTPKDLSDTPTGGTPVKLPPVHWQVHLPFSGHGTAATQELQKQKEIGSLMHDFWYNPRLRDE
ncbi:hypothetical protein ACFE04_019628 [Oxalis oulophora]